MSELSTVVCIEGWAIWKNREKREPRGTSFYFLYMLDAYRMREWKKYTKENRRKRLKCLKENEIKEKVNKRKGVCV